MENKKNVFWLGMTSFFNDVSSEMIMALLPLFLSALGASYFIIGLIEGIAEATSSVFKIVSGWVSDRLQARKGLVVVGYTLSTIIKPLIAIANTWYQVLAVRFMDRIGKGIRNAPRDALIADSVAAHERGRSFGFQRGMDTFGAVVGTLLASALLFIFGNYFNMELTLQYRTIFWIAVIPGALSVIAVSLMVKDVKVKSHESDGKNIKWSSFGNGFIAFLIVSAIFELSNFSYAIFLLRASSLGVVVALIPIIYLLYNIVYASLSQPLGILSDRIGKKTVLFSGYLLAALLCFGFAQATQAYYAWLLFAVYGIVSAVTNTVPRALLADFVAPERRGTAYGIYYMLIGAVAFPASAIAGLLWDNFGAVTAFSYGGFLALVASVLVLLLIPGRSKLTRAA